MYDFSYKITECLHFKLPFHTHNRNSIYSANSRTGCANTPISSPMMII